jgi:hypothetical protein
MVRYAKGQARSLPPPDVSFMDWQIEALFQVPPPLLNLIKTSGSWQGPTPWARQVLEWNFTRQVAPGEMLAPGEGSWLTAMPLPSRRHFNPERVSRSNTWRMV